MAQNSDMVSVKVGNNTFKVRAKDLDTYLKAHEGAEVVGGYETKAATKKAPAKKKDE